MDRFQSLLWDLGEILDLPLHVDKNHACSLLLDEKLTLQLEMDQSGEELVAVAYIAEIPPGRFRENVLREAMKVNAFYHPFGTLGYAEKLNALVLQSFLPAKDLTGEKLVAFLELFSKEAESWRTAIANSQPAPADYLRAYGNKPSPYNLPKNGT